MRTIKFRGWDLITKEMFSIESIEFGYVDHLIKEITSSEDFGALQNGVNDGDYERVADYVELMQFTGLLDKNGKEIFESDVVSSHYKLGIVKWDEIEARFRVYCKEQLPMPANYPVTSDWEVIGNIYSNPELAERTE